MRGGDLLQLSSSYGGDELLWYAIIAPSLDYISGQWTLRILLFQYQVVKFVVITLALMMTLLISYLV